MKEYKRLTTKCEVGIGLTATNGNIVNDYEKVLNRLAKLEDKIENGTLVFIDEPFWSEYHDCWAVFQRTEDIVQTCYMTVNQAKDYKNRKEIKGDTE